MEAIEAGETHITKSCLPKYIHSLQCIDVTDERPNPCKVLEKQYKVSYYKVHKAQIYDGMRLGFTALVAYQFFLQGEKNDAAVEFGN